MPPIAEQVPVKMGKFQASKLIVRESWNLLKQDKEIMWFPVVSTFFTLLVALIMGVVFFLVFLSGARDNSVAFYSTLLVYYVLLFFVINFFQAGLFIVVQSRFSGQNLSFSQGITGAKAHLTKIFLWSVISATVGLILQIISDKFKFIGRIVASLLGAAWNIMTFFSLPALVIGDLSIKESFGESARIIRKTWGETIIVKFGVGLFFGLLIVLIFIIAMVIVILAPTYYVLVPVSLLVLVSVIILSIISSTLGSIFKLVLYNYARTGEVPTGFSPEVVKGAIK